MRVLRRDMCIAETSRLTELWLNISIKLGFTSAYERRSGMVFGLLGQQRHMISRSWDFWLMYFSFKMRTSKTMELKSLMNSCM